MNRKNGASLALIITLLFTLSTVIVVSASTLGAYHYLTDEGAYFTNNGNMT